MVPAEVATDAVTDLQRETEAFIDGFATAGLSYRQYLGLQDGGLVAMLDVPLPFYEVLLEMAHPRDGRWDSDAGTETFKPSYTPAAGVRVEVETAAAGFVSWEAFAETPSLQLSSVANSLVEARGVVRVRFLTDDGYAYLCYPDADTDSKTIDTSAASSFWRRIGQPDCLPSTDAELDELLSVFGP